jgi:hypothetical protein
LPLSYIILLCQPSSRLFQIIDTRYAADARTALTRGVFSPRAWWRQNSA